MAKTNKEYQEIEKFYNDSYVINLTQMLVSSAISFDMIERKTLAMALEENFDDDSIYIKYAQQVIMIGDMLKKHGETYYPTVFNDKQEGGNND